MQFELSHRKRRSKTTDNRQLTTDNLPPRILHIIPTLDPHGAEKQLTLLATGLARERFDVHVCALTRGGPFAEPLQQAGIPVEVIGKRWKVDPLAYWRLKRHIRRLKPDLVHTWLFAANSYGRAAARACGVRRIVAAERCVDQWKLWHELAIDRRLARATDRIVANSRAVRDFYVARGLPAEKFVVIPNGVPPAEASDLLQRGGQAPFAPRTPQNPPRRTADSRAEFLQELGLPPDVRLIGAVGRLWPQKRVKDLVWAIDQLRTMCPQAHLLVIGDGPQRAALERLRRLYEVEAGAHFLGNRTDVARFLPHFDAFWLASAYEGQSNALMEAMAAGVAVVASDIPANRELVTSGENGVLVPLNVRSEFARRTLMLLEDLALATKLAAAGRQRMLAEFSVERMVDRYAALYGELLGGSGT